MAAYLSVALSEGICLLVIWFSYLNLPELPEIKTIPLSRHCKTRWSIGWTLHNFISDGEGSLHSILLIHCPTSLADGYSILFIKVPMKSDY